MGLFTKDDFIYDKATDSYRCPAGETLNFHFEGTRRSRPQRPVRYYWTSACTRCALRSRCTQDGRRRRINRTPEEPFVEDMRARVAAAPEILRRRKAIVEHPFGTMKRWMNQGYFLTRGRARGYGVLSAPSAAVGASIRQSCSGASIAPKILHGTWPPRG